MDIRLLLATEPSPSYDDRAAAARCRAISSASSEETTHSTATSLTASNLSGLALLRRDTTRVLKGLFDGQSNHSGSRPGSPTPAVSAVHNATTPLDEDLPLPVTHQRRSRPAAIAKRSQKISVDPSCGVPKQTKGKSAAPAGPAPLSASSTATAAIGTSFSYAPLPPDYSRRTPEYDFAAAQHYIETVDSSDGDATPEEPQTPPPDYMGLGTPIITPRLLAKVLQAHAAGQALQLDSVNRYSYRGSTAGKAKKSQRRKKEGERGKGRSDKGKEKAAKKRPLPNGERDDSLAPSTSSKGAGVKRGRDEDTWGAGSERSGKKGKRQTSRGVSTGGTEDGDMGKAKKWKGYALQEVSSDSEEDQVKKDKGKKKLYDENGDLIEDSGESSDSSLESEIEKVKHKPGWKGWTIAKEPPDTSKLVLLDAPPMVLNARATRSGRTFGDENWDEATMGPRPRPAASATGEDGVSKIARKGSKLSISEHQNRSR